MENKTTFDNAVGLAEEVLAVREETFQLSKVENLTELMQGLSMRQLSFFCRVLALLVYEPEERLPEGDLKTSSHTHKQALEWDRANQHRADANHVRLLEVPDALQRLVRLIKVQCMPYGQWTDRVVTHLPSSGMMLPMFASSREQGDWDEFVLDESWGAMDISSWSHIETIIAE
eukprot:3985936-Pyramimonas_sp.AAC.1